MYMGSAEGKTTALDMIKHVLDYLNGNLLTWKKTDPAELILPC